MGKAGAVTEGADVANGADVARLNELIVRQRRELDEIRSQTVVRSIVDLATGMLMEQLGCSPAEAREPLTHLDDKAGSSVAELAAHITHQPPPGEGPGSACRGRPSRPRQTDPRWPAPCSRRPWPRRARSRWRCG